MNATEFLIELYTGLEDALLINLFAANDDGVHGETYSLSEVRTSDVVQKFVSRQQELKRNVYYGLNPLRRVPDNMKAAKDDVDEDVWFVHADIDVPEDLDRAKIPEWKREKTAKLMPAYRSSILVDSGNGLQAILRLEEHVTHNRAEEINRLLCDHPDYQADTAAIDVCRVLRLPGTTNYPTPVKRERGYVECPAKVLKMGNQPFIPEKFQPATDLDDIPEEIQEIILHGKRGEKEYEGPSQARFAAMVMLFRDRQPEARIRDIISNRDYFIAPKNKKKMTARWINHELAAGKKAYQDAIPDHIKDLNREYFATMREGKFLIGSEIYDEDWERHRFISTTPTSLRQLYSNDRVRVGDANVNKIDSWMAHPLRRTYHAMVMRPDIQSEEFIDDATGKLQLNMWRGFSVSPEIGECPLFEELVNDVVCDGDNEIIDYVWGWMARGVQEPEKQAEVALVMRGDRGTGKGTFANYFGELFGDHYLTISNQHHLTGNFNSHLHNCLCLFADEAMWAGSQKAASVLKSYITEKVIAVEAKFFDAKNVRNRLKIIMASNESWVVPAGADERRFCVIQVTNKRQKDLDWFGKLHAQMKGGGRAALLHKLMNYDLSNFEIRRPPETAALNEQKDESLDAFEAFWRDELDEGSHGSVRHATPDITWGVVPSSYLFDRYMRHKARNPNRSGPTNNVHFGRRLAEVIPASGKKSNGGLKRGDEMVWEVVKDVTEKGYPYRLPSLKECRASFEEALGRKFEWSDAEEVTPDPAF